MSENVLTPQDFQAVTDFATYMQQRFGAELQGIVLYGSKARKTATADSDIDLLVILTDADWRHGDRVSDIAFAVSLAHDVLLLPHIVSLAQWRKMTAAPFSFFHEVFRDGWPVYGAAEIFTPLRRQQVTPLYDTAVLHI